MGSRVRGERPQTWVTRVAAQMRDFARAPSKWWIYGPTGLDLQGHQPEEYCHLQENIILMVAVDFYPGKNARAVWRLQLGSDKYKASEIPLAVLDEAKRVIFGNNMPLAMPCITRKDGREWWTLEHVMSPEEGIFLLHGHDPKAVA